MMAALGAININVKKHLRTEKSEHYPFSSKTIAASKIAKITLFNAFGMLKKRYKRKTLVAVSVPMQDKFTITVRHCLSFGGTFSRYRVDIIDHAELMYFVLFDSLELATNWVLTIDFDNETNPDIVLVQLTETLEDWIKIHT